MSIQILDVLQGSPEWRKARAGRPTASEFATMMAGGEGKTRRKMMFRLAGEIITGEPEETFSNAAMDRGNAMEQQARDMYCLVTNAKLERVGFVVNGRVGASPDSLIGKDGVLEVKTQIPSLLIDRHFTGTFPTEHVAQCQGLLWVTEREWVDLAVFWPGIPLFRRRLKRDEQYIKRLQIASEAFLEELDEVVAQVRKIGAG